MAATEAAESTRNLRTYRETLSLSQAELARIAGISRYKLNQYEQGCYELTPEELGQIRDALQVEIQRLQQVPEPPVFGIRAGRAEGGAPA
jgi:transcriptional regulator with XRE-family HTH domain